jgi:hypothetical protein
MFGETYGVTMGSIYIAHIQERINSHKILRKKHFGNAVTLEGLVRITLRSRVLGTEYDDERFMEDAQD